MLKATGISCYRDGRQLFAGIDLTLAKGELWVMRGANGSGKTTLLRALAGLFQEFDGVVERAATILYLGHLPGLSASLTAAENLRWLAAMEPPGGEAPLISAALARVGLDGYGNVLVGRLSAGQQRRVALARLVLTGHSLWLLDEPLIALDRAGEQLLGELLTGHCAGGGAALVTSHQDLPVAVSGWLELPG